MKLRTIALLAAVCFLCGCAAKTEPAAPVLRFREEPVRLVQDTYAWEGTLSLEENGATLCITAPEALRGAVYACFGGCFTVSCGSVSVSFSQEELPRQGIFSFLQALLRLTSDHAALPAERIICDAQGNVLSIRGETWQADFPRLVCTEPSPVS